MISSTTQTAAMTAQYFLAKDTAEFGVAISPQMEAALVKGMAVYAENRYQSMSEFMDALMADSADRLFSSSAE